MGLELLWRVVRSHSVIESSARLAKDTLEPASHFSYRVSKLYNGSGMVVAGGQNPILSSTVLFVLCTRFLSRPLTPDVVSKLYNGIGMGSGATQRVSKLYNGIVMVVAGGQIPFCHRKLCLSCEGDSCASLSLL
eukprot:scaffold483647_cov248-Attheya_sp.AAC.1